MTPPPKPRYACDCLKITEGQVVKAIRDQGLTTLREVTACTEAGAGCNSCHPLIREYLERERARAATSPRPRPAVRTDSSRALSL